MLMDYRHSALTDFLAVSILERIRIYFLHG